MNFQQVIYITGVPRSGTSWLGQIINSSPQVCFRFQPLFSYEFKNRVNEDSSSEVFERFFECLSKTESDFIGQKDKIKSGEYPLFQKQSATHLAFKENHYQSMIEPILRKVPSVKVIGIVRNPCAVINSWRKNPKEFPHDSDILEEWRFANCKNKGNGDYFGYYKWKEVTNNYIDLQIKYPDRFFLLKYEDLVHQPAEVTKEIFRFAGLPFEEQTKDFLKTSTTKNNESYYSVFKANKNTEEWKNELDSYIQSEIFADLKNTRLEKFLW